MSSPQTEPAGDVLERVAIPWEDAKAIAASALQTACETDPADPDHPNTIMLTTDDFETIVRCAVENHELATLTSSTPVASGEVGRAAMQLGVRAFILESASIERDALLSELTGEEIESLVHAVLATKRLFTPTHDDVGKIVAWLRRQANLRWDEYEKLPDKAGAMAKEILVRVSIIRRMAQEIERGDWRDTPSNERARK